VLARGRWSVRDIELDLQKKISLWVICIIQNGLLVDKEDTGEVLAANYYFASEFDLHVKSALHLGWIFAGESVTITRNVTYVLVNNRNTAS
jgi:hypothetical protein